MTVILMSDRLCIEYIGGRAAKIYLYNARGVQRRNIDMFFFGSWLMCVLLQSSPELQLQDTFVILDYILPSRCFAWTFAENTQ